MADIQIKDLTESVAIADDDKLAKDNATTDITRFIRWSLIKSTLKSYFDTLYQAVGSYITASGVTYENLDANGDVGTSAGQVAIGNHTHTGVYEPANANLFDISVDDLDDITDGTTYKKFSATEQTKLSGIESGADVTDSTNVAASGAIMDGDFSSNGLMKRTGSGTYSTASAGDVDTIAPTQTGNSGKFLTTNGTNTSWGTPSGSGDVVGPGSSTDNALARFDSTTGKLLQNSLVTSDDSGSVNIPSGQSYKINNYSTGKRRCGTWKCY